MIVYYLNLCAAYGPECRSIYNFIRKNLCMTSYISVSENKPLFDTKSSFLIIEIGNFVILLLISNLFSKNKESLQIGYYEIVSVVSRLFQVVGISSIQQCL